MSREEGDVSLAREFHLSLDEVRRLNQYDKRLMMGWAPFDRERAEKAAKDHVAGMMALVKRHGVKHG